MNDGLRKRTLSWSNAVLDVESVPSTGLRVLLEPNEKERKAIADRLDIPAVKSLAVAIDCHPEASGATRLDGRLKAELTRACVVTDDPVEERIDEPFDSLVVKQEPDLSPETDIDEPDFDVAPDGEVDLAEVATQYLAIAMTPYPRSPGADAEVNALLGEEPSPPADRQNPFADLARSMAAQDPESGRK